MSTKPEIDHFVIAAATIEQGVNYIQSKLNVEIPAGGEHPKMGTHNHLMNIGNTFLEVIAINPAIHATRTPRWFDLDSPTMQSILSEQPQLITWVVRTSNIEETHKRSDYPESIIETVSRGSLTWKITIPKDGSLSHNGIYPTFIQWPEDVKPWENMRNMGFHFNKLQINCPAAGQLTQSLKNLEVPLDDSLQISDSPKNKMNLSLTGSDNTIINFESTQTVNRCLKKLS